MRNRIHLSSALLLAGLMTPTLGCRKDDVSKQSVAKPGVPPPAASAGNLPQGHPPLGGGMPGMEGPSQGPLPVTWTLPKGWVSTGGTGLRAATLKPSAESPVEVSVIALAGAAGGELANVNRWRGQIGLQPVDEKALGGMRQALKAPGGPVTVFDLTADGKVKTRMVVGTFLLPSGDSWFFKLTGDPEPVGKAKPAFLTLLESLRLANAK